MVIFPKAKINIGLRITDKRSDGYHNLETIFYPVNLSDALEFVVPREKLTDDIFTISGLQLPGKAEENLVMKALSVMREIYPVPFLKIHLHKIIPSGAGLGGGSSDAAAFLKILNRYFSLNLTNDRLKEFALSLGSDCPYFIDGKPTYAEGRGELMTPLNPLPEGEFLVLLKPEINVSTREAFQGCVPHKNENRLTDLYNREIPEWKSRILNDFEKTVIARYPEIGEMKNALYGMGALYSSMTGSGSALYGIFEKRPFVPESLRKFLIYSGTL